MSPTLKPRDLVTGVLRRVVVPLYARRFAERNLELGAD